MEEAGIGQAYFGQITRFRNLGQVDAIGYRQAVECLLAFFYINVRKGFRQGA